MKKRHFILLAASMLSLLSMADVPVGYYHSLDGKSGQALKNAVHELTKNRTVHSYSSLWYYFRETDHMANDASRVWDMYSNKTYYFTSNGTGATSGMNKEHSVPKSWWGGGNENQGFYAYTDLNHLYPSDADANSAKLNYPLGEVSTVYFDNGVSKTGTPEYGQGGGSSVVFEPDSIYKGDFARTYFYMAACYQDYTWKYKYMYTETSWLTLNQWSIDLLLRWAREDPVSDKEKARNEAVFRCQNNRNPFIDNPELIEYIWGDRAGEVFNVGGGDAPEGDPEIITPTKDMVFDLGPVALGKTATIKFPVKGVNLTNNVSLMLYRYDYEMFQLSVSSIDRVIANSEGGYMLTVTYTPTQLGEHRTRLVFSDGGITGSYGIWLKAECLEAPNLSTPVALEPLEITDSTYIAAWEPAAEVIDSYLVNRVIYDSKHNVIDSETFATDDASQTTMLFTDRKPGEFHTYTVQTYRLGYISEKSNIITLDPAGISGVKADLPMAFIPSDHGVLVKCGSPLNDVRIYTPAGQLIRRIPRVNNDMTIHLPMGVYIITSANLRTATKLVVR